MSESTPLVSLVMPAYNASAFIVQAIDSVIGQTYSHWELLIADDGSQDDTKAIIDRYEDPRIKTFHNEANQGYPATCNKLLALAKGDYITFQDADDYATSDRLELLLKAFEKQPTLGMVGSAIQIVTETGEVLRTDTKPESYEEIQAVVEESNPFCGAALMVTRQVYDDIGGYRPYFLSLRYQDFDWSSRIMEKYPAINLPQPLYFYRQNAGSNSKKINPKSGIALKLVRHLMAQRKATGADDLMRGKQEAVDEQMAEWLRPYEQDPALVYREAAAMFMYNKMYAQAISASWQATQIRPLQLVNARTWAYCVRKTLIKR
ncbi:MAG: glycosyltransferase [Bacteroidota bacterium]